jgi:diguanylate cyclase (GGDEF)-like protein
MDSKLQTPMSDDFNFFSDFIDNIPIGISAVDSTTKLPNSYNKYFINMFGCDALEIDTKDKWYHKAYPNEFYRKELIKKWTTLIKYTEENKLLYSTPIEVNINCKNGSVKICECIYYRRENFIYSIFTDITKQKLHEKKLFSLSLTDELTQLDNRKSYYIRIKELITLYKRYGIPFTILMYDIDDFKHINDTYGHNIGDKVLIDMSKDVKKNIRKNDYLFRVGGEEFVILLSDTNLDKSKYVAEKIRKDVESLEMVRNEVITISIGLTEVKENDTISSLYKRVDSLLYFSKKNGKNIVSSEIIGDVIHAYYFDEETKTVYERINGTFMNLDAFKNTLMNDEYMTKVFSYENIITDFGGFDMNFDHFEEEVMELFTEYQKTFVNKKILVKKFSAFLSKFDNENSVEPFQKLLKNYGIQTKNFKSIDEISEFIGFDVQKYFDMDESELTISK